MSTEDLFRKIARFMVDCFSSIFALKIFNKSINYSKKIGHNYWNVFDMNKIGGL